MRPTVFRAAAVLLAAALAACAEKAEPAIELRPVSFGDLEGWAEDDLAGALPAFRASCAAIARKAPGDAMGREPWSGKVADWQPACAAAASAGDTPAAARGFFEQQFVPVALGDRGNAEGLFTGYYEPLLMGSRTAGGRFAVPLHGRPADLVNVDLGTFDDSLEGKRIAGRVRGGRLEPYPDRAAIDAGALDGGGWELLWVDDPVAKFFLQIQGSGLVELAEGHRVRVGYADQNGRSYRAIGRDLVEMGALTREEVSLQTIRDWLRAHPDQAAAIMEKNPSYVFFRELGDATVATGPQGAQGIELTPGRSIAVDRRFVALGVPLWLQATAPFPDGDRPLRRLMVAQDTGGAIKGPVRGDVFWGTGPLAEHVAGHMKSPGRWFALLPRSLAPSS
ncbi:MAG TPA: MltA domain-containing protein [Geminicoccaceae bacterium]|nr:MltA domain-containing protein [Geminicoccus sp.]HMU51587.1 MltA domain-containing protein [Geminicoccaceae bacterium]